MLGWFGEHRIDENVFPCAICVHYLNTFSMTVLVVFAWLFLGGLECQFLVRFVQVSEKLGHNLKNKINECVVIDRSAIKRL
jgi:hypothetical protein